MSKLLINGGLLIDAAGTPPIPEGCVLIEGEQIVAAGPKTDIGPVSDAAQLNLEGHTLLPGLIDCHNHLSMDLSQEDWLARIHDSEAEKTISAIINMKKDLKSGVTTTRCLGEKNYLDIACKKAVESGRLSGPRLLTAGKSIRSTHGHGILAHTYDGVDQVRLAVRENIKAGADLIKFLTTATVRGGGDIRSDYSREEIFAAIDEAHRAGLRVTAHCIGGQALRWCVEAGIDAIEHGYFVSDQEIELLIHSGCWLVITLSPFFMEERLKHFPSANAFRSQRKEVAERMAAAIKSEANIALGSDAVHGLMAREMEYMVELGATEAQALAAGTTGGAALCGIQETVGVLKPGYSADIIAVEGNPLDDISSLNKVSVVVCRGKVSSTYPSKQTSIP